MAELRVIVVAEPVVAVGTIVEEQSTFFVSEWGVTDTDKLSVRNDRLTGVLVIKVLEAPGTESDTDKAAMLQNEENELSVTAMKVGR